MNQVNLSRFSFLGDGNLASRHTPNDRPRPLPTRPSTPRHLPFGHTYFGIVGGHPRTPTSSPQPLKLNPPTQHDHGQPPVPRTPPKVAKVLVTTGTQTKVFQKLVYAKKNQLNQKRADVLAKTLEDVKAWVQALYGTNVPEELLREYEDLPTEIPIARKGRRPRIGAELSDPLGMRTPPSNSQEHPTTPRPYLHSGRVSKSRGTPSSNVSIASSSGFDLSKSSDSQWSSLLGGESDKDEVGVLTFSGLIPSSQVTLGPSPTSSSFSFISESPRKHIPAPRSKEETAKARANLIIDRALAKVKGGEALKCSPAQRAILRIKQSQAGPPTSPKVAPIRVDPIKKTFNGVEGRKKLFQCPRQGCRRIFYSKLSLSKHRASIHPRLNEYIECPITDCGRKFKAERYLICHLEIHANAGNKSWCCQYCGKLYATRGCLYAHIRTHSKELNLRYKCSLCGIGFSVERYYLAHVKTHDPDYEPPAKKFICPELSCGRLYLTKMHLNRHLLRIHGKGPLLEDETQVKVEVMDSIDENEGGETQKLDDVWEQIPFGGFY